MTHEQLVDFAENCIGRGDIGIQSAFNEQFSDEDFNNLDGEQLGIIDEIVFDCTHCGWLCSTDELNESNDGENVCQDCRDCEDSEDFED